MFGWIWQLITLCWWGLVLLAVVLGCVVFLGTVYLVELYCGPSYTCAAPFLSVTRHLVWLIPLMIIGGVIRALVSRGTRRRRTIVR